jgi:hypothetical protein
MTSRLWKDFLSSARGQRFAHPKNILESTPHTLKRSGHFGTLHAEYIERQTRIPMFVVDYEGEWDSMHVA